MKEEQNVKGLHFEDRRGDNVWSAYIGNGWCYVTNYGSSWGYTLWDGNVCVDGAKHFNWNFYDALDKGADKLIGYVKDGAAIVAPMAEAQAKIKAAKEGEA